MQEDGASPHTDKPTEDKLIRAGREGGVGNISVNASSAVGGPQHQPSGILRIPKQQDLGGAFRLHQ